MKRCRNLPISEVRLVIDDVVLFTPKPSRRREERAFFVRRVRVALVNEWYPERKPKRPSSDLRTYLARSLSVEATSSNAARTSFFTSSTSKRTSWSSPFRKKAANESPAPDRPAGSNPAIPTMRSTLGRMGSTRLTRATPEEAVAAKASLEASGLVATSPEPELPPVGGRLLTIRVDLRDVVLNVIAYDAHFRDTNLMRVINALVGDEGGPEDAPDEDEGEGLVAFKKALVRDTKARGPSGVSDRVTFERTTRWSSKLRLSEFE